MTSDILNDYDLRKTKGREEILDLFLGHDHALSHADIETLLGKNFDRVTVYRTLKTFLEKGIIHKVLSDQGSPKYALCSDECTDNEHHHEHVHFKCDVCGQTTCLDKVHVPAIQLPKGYTFGEANLLISGRCPSCG